MLTQEYLKSILRYDPETGVWIRVKCFQKRFIGKEVGSIKQTGYRSIKIDGIDYMSSRLACLYMLGRWPVEEMDHKDTDKLNDKWENLREATKAENRRNRNAKINTIVGLKGVKFTTSNKYEAAIKINGISKYLGTFDAPQEAADAYADAAKEAYGEFARHD